MEMFSVISVLSILLGLVSSNGEDCVCVHPSECGNDVVTFTVEDGEINYKTPNCRDIEVCCRVPTEIPHGTQVVRNTRENQAPLLPTKPRLQGCGVRRFKGVGSQTFPKIPQHFIRISDDDPEANTDTFYGELPWLVRLYVNGEFTCGGVLISPKAILTAAHCISGKEAKDLAVEVGEWNSVEAVEPVAPQKQNVVHVIRHNQFSSKTGEKDIAMVFVKKDFTFNEAVDYICLPERFREVNQADCYAAGWGKGKETDTGYSPILRKVAMPILNHTSCEGKFKSATGFGSSFKLGPGFVCSGGLDNRDTCRGDGGGPLYCSMKMEPGRYAAVGIISWGIGCSKGYPTVSVSIPHFKKWIDDGLYSWSNNVLPRLGD